MLDLKGFPASVTCCVSPLSNLHISAPECVTFTTEEKLDLVTHNREDTLFLKGSLEDI